MLALAAHPDGNGPAVGPLPLYPRLAAAVFPRPYTSWDTLLPGDIPVTEDVFFKSGAFSQIDFSEGYVNLNRGQGYVELEPAVSPANGLLMFGFMYFRMATADQPGSIIRATMSLSGNLSLAGTPRVTVVPCIGAAGVGAPFDPGIANLGAGVTLTPDDLGPRSFTVPYYRYLLRVALLGTVSAYQEAGTYGKIRVDIEYV